MEAWIRIRGDGQWQIVEMQKARGAVPLGITELVGAIARQQEQAVLLPLEGPLLLAVARPDGRQPATVDDVDCLVERELQARKRGPGWNLRDARFGDALLPGEFEESSVALPLIPAAERDGAHVLDEVPIMNGDSSRFDPLVVRGLAVP